MPVLSGSLPIRRYRVNSLNGTPPNFHTMLRDGLSANTYIESDPTSVWQGQRSGWASIDNYLNEDASHDCMVGEYAVFSVRIDTKSAPPGRVRALLAKEIDAWKAERNAKHVPRDVKQQLKEQVTNDVLAKTPPRTKIIDVAWNTEQDWLVLGHLSDGIADAFMRNFGSSFGGLGLELWQPFGTEEEMVSDLERTAGDFYLWLWWSIATGQELRGVESIAIDGKIVLSGRGGETSVQHENVDAVPEAKAALLDGKRPSMMKLKAEIDGLTYSFAVSGTRAFMPNLKLPEAAEKKARVDREAAIIDRLGAYDRLHDTFEGWIKDFRALQAEDAAWSAVWTDITTWMQE